MARPKNIKEKGFFICRGHRPCRERLPRTAITEWLELAAICSDISDLIVHPDGSIQTLTRSLSSDTRTNAQWLKDELDRLVKANDDPTFVYAIHKSSCERFGCIIKHKKKQDRHPHP